MENKHAKTTNVELRKNPERSTRVKKRQDLMLVQLDLPQRSFKIVREKTSHSIKVGIRQGASHFLMIEEVIYLAELGAAAVLVDPNSSEFLSLNQLFALLPLFNVTLYQFCAFRSITKANYRVRKPSEEKKLYDYDVYMNSINGILFDEHLCDNFLKFHLFVGRQNQSASDDLREFAKKAKVPVYVANGQPSCVRFSELLSPIKSDFQMISNGKLILDDSSPP